MFPYPSGAGLHVGHPEGYTATDIVSRMKRMQGYNVLHPMGWDAFGLPAEQYAIDTGNDPADFTKQNIATLSAKLNRLVSLMTGTAKSIQRTRIITNGPNGFLSKLYEKGLAYIDEVAVNWCPALGTVLANEEVIDGKSERGGHPVERRPMKQWMLKITAYADRLLEDLEELDWPESLKGYAAQLDWSFGRCRSYV